MVRIAKKTDPQRIADLKKKIRDSTYVEDAIQKIAHRLSSEIIHSKNG